MKVTKKPKIEAIYPMNFIQQGLLFHHISSSADQGFLNVQCDVEGEIDPVIFENALNKIVERYQVMRSTVHWENLEKPVQIVHQQKTVNFKFLDWQTESAETQEISWKNLKAKYQTVGAKFNEGALLDILLVRLDKTSFRLLWPSHHLLIDGWSSNNILKAVFTSYDALSKNVAPSFENLPSHKSYVSWLNETSVEKAAQFWKGYFNGFEQSSLFDSGSLIENYEPETISNHLSPIETQALTNYARESKVSLNTVLQSVWSLLLSRYFGKKDVVHGTTVSGRSPNFPNVEALAGMYMNVQPIRGAVTNEDELLSDWLVSNQEKQLEALSYQHLGMDELMNYIERPVGQTLFDSLFIFENYPVVETSNETVKVSNFSSGLTSTYPITMAVLPSDEMKFVVSVLPDMVDEKSAAWLLENFHKIVTLLVSKKIKSYSELESHVPVFLSESSLVNSPTEQTKKVAYSPAVNETQTKLVQIWEGLFGHSKIGIHDNFFEIGGKSMLAVKLFTAIQKGLDKKLAPTTLLKNPTIAALARIVDGEIENQEWKYLVPLKTSGKKAPLFCIHAGGGHVFFYNDLAKLIDDDRPVYAMQPSGIYDETEMHQNIEQMAIDYVAEIRSAHPEGPYHIMVYCFSTAVGLEMSLQLDKMGQKVNLIVMDTMAEQTEKLTSARVKMRVLGFVKRLARQPIETVQFMVLDRVNRRLKPIWTNMVGSSQQKDIEKMRANLSRIYTDYKWKSHPIKISLVLTEKVTKSFNAEVLNSWESIAANGVDVSDTKGNHRSLFEEPDVGFVAKTIDQCIDAKHW